MFQVPNSHVWLVAAILDRTGRDFSITADSFIGQYWDVTQVECDLHHIEVGQAACKLSKLYISHHPADVTVFITFIISSQ